MYEYQAPGIVRIKLVTDRDNLVCSMFKKVLNIFYILSTVYRDKFL